MQHEQCAAACSMNRAGHTSPFQFMALPILKPPRSTTERYRLKRSSGLPLSTELGNSAGWMVHPKRDCSTAHTVYSAEAHRRADPCRGRQQQLHALCPERLRHGGGGVHREEVDEVGEESLRCALRQRRAVALPLLDRRRIGGELVELGFAQRRSTVRLAAAALWLGARHIAVHVPQRARWATRLVEARKRYLHACMRG
jgi:hypothetical protein